MSAPRRGLTGVAFIYLAASWAAIQVVSTITPIFDWPSWLQKVVVIVCAAGFPCALILAWLFDITPSGIRRHSDDAPVPEGYRRRVGKWIVAAGVVLLFAGGSYSTWSRVRVRRVQSQPLAIMPFTVANGDSAAAALGDGLAADLIDNLGRISKVQVLGRATALLYRDSVAVRPRLVASLGAFNVLTGELTPLSDGVELRVVLAQAGTDRVLWRAHFEQRGGDMAVVQQALLQRLVEDLKMTTSSSAVATSTPSDTRVYNDFLRARSYIERPTREAQDLARDLLRKTLSGDPTFAPAYAQLARYFVRQRWNFGGGPELVDSALNAAHHALSIDADLSSAHAALGLAELAHGAMEPAERELTRAIELNPSAASVYGNLGAFNGMNGREAEARRNFARAAQLDPAQASGYLVNIATIDAGNGMLDEAERMYEAALARNPEFAYAERGLLRVHMARGDTAAALQLSQKLIDSHPTDAAIWLDRGEVLLQAGDVSKARAAFARATDISKMGEGWLYSAPVLLAYAELKSGARTQARALIDDYQRAAIEDIEAGGGGRLLEYGLAAAYAMRGDNEKALGQLEKAVDASAVSYMDFRIDPILGMLRGEPRYAAVMQRLKMHADSMTRIARGAPVRPL